jgi:hypothetical protein
LSVGSDDRIGKDRVVRALLGPFVTSECPVFDIATIRSDASRNAIEVDSKNRVLSSGTVQVRTDVPVADGEVETRIKVCDEIRPWSLEKFGLWHR